MITQCLVKTIVRKSAAPVAKYNHDDMHPDHKGRTDIREDLGYKSECLERFGGWSKIDEYEAEHSEQKKQNNSCREYIVSLPNEWADKPEYIEQFIKKTSESFASLTGFDENQLLMEITFHYNHGQTQETDNFHCHVMISERQLETEMKQDVYKKDIWQNEKTGRLCKPHAENGILRHRKGELKYDKQGNPVYISSGSSYLSAKAKAMRDASFLDSVKLETKKNMESIDPGLQLIVGKENDLQLTRIKYTRQEERLYPERVQLIKEINDERTKINHDIKAGLDSNSISREDAEIMVNQWREYLTASTRTRDPDEKMRILSNVKLLTEARAKEIHDWVTSSMDRVRDFAKDILNVTRERFFATFIRWKPIAADYPVAEVRRLDNSEIEEVTVKTEPQASYIEQSDILMQFETTSFGNGTKVLHSVDGIQTERQQLQHRERERSFHR